MNYVDHVYKIILAESEFFDALYEDYIIHIVGHTGLNELKRHNLLETCGVINGKQLYAVVTSN